MSVAKGNRDGARYIGRQGQVFLVELRDYVPPNLLDLEGTSLTFTPVSGGYQVSAGPLVWEEELGDRTSATAFGAFPSERRTLDFAFPFAGALWREISVNAYGNLTFAGDQGDIYDPARNRFLLLSSFAEDLANKQAIVPLFRKFAGAFGFPSDPENVNAIWFRGLIDRAIVTWDVSEPYHADIQNFFRAPRRNRFQAQLRESGEIIFSYAELSVEDGIVGVFDPTTPACGEPTILERVEDPVDPSLPGYLDVTSLTVSDVGVCGLEVAIALAGSPSPEGDSALAQRTYRVHVDGDEPLLTGVDFDDVDATPRVDVDADFRYVGAGGAQFGIDGDVVRIRFQPGGITDLPQIALFVDTVDFDDASPFPFDQTAAVTVHITGLDSTSQRLVDLSEQRGGQTPSSILYEAFHYVVPPHQSIPVCALLEAVGDRFDMAAVFTDFRIDTQEAGATSSGPIGREIGGLASSTIGIEPAAYCSQGRLQVVQDFIASDTSILQATGPASDPWQDYAPQVAMLSHELGHGWMSFGDVEINGESFSIRDGVHWAFELHVEAPATIDTAFDNSPMAGSFWIDEGGGQFRRPAPGFFYPPKGYAWLDLYLMGLARPDEVPDFFFVDNARYLRTTSQGDIYTGNRVNITIEDFVAANGVRSPAAGEAPSDFAFATIGLVLPDQLPTAPMIEQVSGAGTAFESYFSAATQQRGSVNACLDLDADPSDAMARTQCAQPQPNDLRQLSGPWFTEGQAGHGWFVEKLEGDRINAYWYVYLNGAPVWLLGSGPIANGHAVLEVFVTSGPDFPPNFDPADVELQRWGTLRMNFETDGAGTVAWQSVVPAFPSFGTQPMSKLASIDSTESGCRSGSYFNVDQSGHGIVAQVLDVQGEPQLLLAWYVYRAGQQIWLLGQAPLGPESTVIPLSQFTGSDFPPAFSSETVSSVPWGSATISFPTDNSATFSWESELSGFGSGQLAMERLTHLADDSCR